MGSLTYYISKHDQLFEGDIMEAIQKLATRDGRGFVKLNQALFTLIPKRPDASEVGHYRPID
jgi:hypothetical protein